MANNFEQYRMNGCVFEFVSTSATALNSTNTALGKVLMATEYNVLNPPFADEQSMLATEFSNYGKPASNLLHAIECAPGQVPNELYYVRATNPTTGDLRLFDLGNFQLATSGMQAASNVGGLWVTYDVTLVKPLLSRVISFAVLSDDHFTWDWATMDNWWHVMPSNSKEYVNWGIGGGAVVTDSGLLSEKVSYRQALKLNKPELYEKVKEDVKHTHSSMVKREVTGKTTERDTKTEVKTTSGGGCTYYFPGTMGQGYFLVTAHWRGSSGLGADWVVTWPDTTLTNCSYQPLYAGNSTSTMLTAWGNDACIQLLVKITAPGAQISFHDGDATGSSDSGVFELIVVPVSSLTI
jgi:hypothetical protein